MGLIKNLVSDSASYKTQWQIWDQQSLDEEWLTDNSPALVENPGAWSQAAGGVCCEPLRSTGSSGLPTTKS